MTSYEKNRPFDTLCWSWREEYRVRECGIVLLIYAAEERAQLRFFSDDFAVFPNIDGRAVHAGGFAGDLGGAAQSASHGGGEFLARLRFGLSFHGDLSINLGVLPELSYTLQRSAKSR